jgi:hypothetical protein
MNETSNLLQSLVKEGVLSDEDFHKFLKLVDALPVPSTRKSSIEYLFRIVHLSSSQAQLFANTKILQDDLCLQLLLKRYVRTQEYVAARENYANRSNWVKVTEFFMLLWPF